MKIHEHLKVRVAEPNEALPKLSPERMSFWRIEDEFYREYLVSFAPVNQTSCEFLEVSDLQEGDLVCFEDVVFKADDFLERLNEAGFLKMRALGKSIASLRI